MKDKEMIEEMYQEFLTYKHDTLCKVFSYRGMCENFINLGYTKIDYKNIDNIDLIFLKGKRFKHIPEDSVVLTREEYDRLKKLEKDYENMASGYYPISQICDELKLQARKETAEKIYKKVRKLLKKS